jgi:hypothetical protein
MGGEGGGKISILSIYIYTTKTVNSALTIHMILPLQSQYLLSLPLLVAENIDYLRLNSEIKFTSTIFKTDSFLQGAPLLWN